MMLADWLGCFYACEIQGGVLTDRAHDITSLGYGVALFNKNREGASVFRR